ncbi:hypothetical protein LOK49_LG04G01483 [Camellia lanceoleosa]|uniref:Uncharacterized protein n=1 Tax=Camellia lanceoleosa TaxID=1840588 RepID=A0ACC0I4K6_9ERIC|nr:hypothetical protein LOK49_LG04G01483 [Camellia lanceoleosa]
MLVIFMGSSCADLRSVSCVPFERCSCCSPNYPPQIGEILSVHNDDLHKACVIYLLLNKMEFGLKKYKDFAFYIVTTLFDVMKQEQELANNVLKEMIMLVGAKTSILRKRIGFFVGAMLSIAELKGVAEKKVELAIEFVVIVAKDRKQGYGMIEKLDHDLTRLLSVLLIKLVITEDDSSWYEADSDNNDDYKVGKLGKFCYGKEDFGRLIVALRGNAIVPNYQKELLDFLVDKDWRKRHGATIKVQWWLNSPEP